MKNYVNDEKLADYFLVERNRANLKVSRQSLVTFSTVGIDTIYIHEIHDLN